jgi:hypothetical protein
MCAVVDLIDMQINLTVHGARLVAAVSHSSDRSRTAWYLKQRLYFEPGGRSSSGINSQQGPSGTLAKANPEGAYDSCVSPSC